MIDVLKIPASARSEERIAALIEEFGAWRILGAALKALLSRWPRPAIDLAHLPDHLRRDVGLPPEQGPPPSWTLLR